MAGAQIVHPTKKPGKPDNQNHAGDKACRNSFAIPGMPASLDNSDFDIFLMAGFRHDAGAGGIGDDGGTQSETAQEARGSIRRMMGGQSLAEQQGGRFGNRMDCARTMIFRQRYYSCLRFCCGRQTVARTLFTEGIAADIVLANRRFSSFSSNAAPPCYFVTSPTSRFALPSPQWAFQPLPSCWRAIRVSE